MAKSYAYVLLALTMFASGCATTETEPGPEKSVMEESPTMTAEGVGASEKEAADLAFAALSRVFESRVKSDTHDRIIAVIGRDSRELSEQMIDSRIEVASDVKFKGVRIAKRWKEGGLHHALAELDKKTARQTWFREITDLDRKIEARLESLDSRKSSLTKYKSLKAVEESWIQRQVLVSRLLVLGGSRGPVPTYRIESVYKDILEIKAGIPVFVDVTGTAGNEIKSGVIDSLGRAGFVMTDSSSDGVILITGTADVRPVNILVTGLKYARCVVSLKVVDAEAGVQVGQITENKRGAHPTESEARDLAVWDALNSASDKVVDFLEGGG